MITRGFSRKTIAIAVAAGMSFGAVTVPNVVAPAVALAEDVTGQFQSGTMELHVPGDQRTPSFVYSSDSDTVTDGSKNITKTNNIYILSSKSEAGTRFTFNKKDLENYVPNGNVQHFRDRTQSLQVRGGFDEITGHTSLERSPIDKTHLSLYGGRMDVLESGRYHYFTIQKPSSGKNANASSPSASDPGVTQKCGGGSRASAFMYTGIVGHEVNTCIYVENPTVTYTYPGAVNPGSSAKFTPKVSSNRAKLKYELVNSPQGATIDAKTGVVTWNVPKNYVGGVEMVSVKATLEGTKMAGANYTPSSTLSMPIRVGGGIDRHLTVKDNKDGTFTISDQDGNELATVVGKDGKDGKTVTSVTKEGNNLVIKYSDESSNKIDLGNGGATITDNGDGTATLTVGKTKIVVPTDKQSLKEVRDNKDGTYTLIRKDETEVKGKIGSPDSIKDIKVNDKGDGLVITRGNGKTENVPFPAISVTETGTGKDRKIVLTLPGGKKVELNAENTFVSSIVKQPNGDYLVTRNDGTKWTISLSDLNNRIKDLEDKDSPSREEFDKVKDELKKAQDGIDGLKGKDAETDKALQGIRDDLNKLKPRVDKLEDRVAKLEKSVIKEVRDNKDGTYTLIRKDDSEVKGNIDTSDSITKIVDNGNGSITIVKADGTEEKVTLSQTVVTETNKGKPNHTITITTPDGKKITFNAFNTYVTEVKKNAKGDYDIYRSDIGDGKTVWKTIVLSDIRGKITKLEGDLSKLTEKQAADVKDIKEQIAGLEKEIESLQGGFGDLDKRVSTLETKVSALTLRVTALEKRVEDLENTDAAWAKCYAGIGEAGVPMLLALPLALMSDLNIPGLDQLNTQIQRTIGVYNPEAAKWMSENRGLFSAATGVLTAAGVLAMLVHAAQECDPYNKTEGVQDNMNPIIDGSSKIVDKIESGSSKPEANAEDKGSSVDAGSSTGEDSGEGSSTEAGSSTGEDK